MVEQLSCVYIGVRQTTPVTRLFSSQAERNKTEMKMKGRQVTYMLGCGSARCPIYNRIERISFQLSFQGCHHSE